MGRCSQRTWLLLAVVALNHGWGCEGFSEDPRTVIYHLPTTVTPLHYTLQIEPDLTKAIVTGNVIIKLHTTANTSESGMDSIILHLGEDSEVDISTITLVASNKTAVGNLSLRYWDDSTMLQVLLPQGTTLAYDTTYTLTMNFSSPLYTEPKGLFWGTYNSSSYYVASAFRATYARNLFPCFDEPQFQVPLVLKVLRPATYNVVFTTSLKSSVASDDKVLDTFKATPAGTSLSSLGLFMSQVAPVSAMGVNLYVPEGYNTTIPSLVTLLDNIVGTMGPFDVPAGTLNLVVLPDLLYTTFSSLGFVFTSPEIYLANVGAQMKWLELGQQFAEQFLQQFLAYSRTPSWWSDLWLSDSLAAYLALNFWPQTSLMQDVQMTQIHLNGFNKDYGDFSGPVVNTELQSRLDIESAIANQTIKNKGLSILVMWHNTLPEGLTMQSVVKFTKLDKSLTTTQDLLDIMVAALQQAKFKKAFIDQIPNWINSVGNPLVKVATRNPNKAMITQSPEGWSDVLWPISISVATESSQNWFKYRQLHLLTGPSMSVKAKSDDWIILNLEIAPYRVNYSSSFPQVLTALKAENASNIPGPIRATILSDVVDLAMYGSLDFGCAMTILNSTQHDQVDWLAMVQAMDTLTALMGTGEWGLTEFGMYVETMFTPDMLAALDLTQSAEHPDQWLARSLLTPWLCRFDIGNCRAAIAQLAPSALDTPEGTTDMIDVNDMDNVACLGARYMATSVDNLLANYATATTPPAKRMFTLALGCVVDSDSVQKVLTKMTTEPKQFSVRDMRDIMVGLASTAENSQTMATFIVENAETLQSWIGRGYLSDVIKSLGKFKIHATKLEQLNSDSVDVDAYVKQSAMATVAKINSSFTWWSVNGPALEQALPQLPTTHPHSPTAPSTEPTTTTPPTTLPTTLSTNSPKTSPPPPTTAIPTVSSAPLPRVAALLPVILVALTSTLLGSH